MTRDINQSVLPGMNSNITHASFGEYMQVFTSDEFEAVCALARIKKGLAKDGLCLVLCSSMRIKYAALQVGCHPQKVSVALRKVRVVLELAPLVAHLRLPKHWA